MEQNFEFFSCANNIEKCLNVQLPTSSLSSLDDYEGIGSAVAWWVALSWLTMTFKHAQQLMYFRCVLVLKSLFFIITLLHFCVVTREQQIVTLAHACCLPLHTRYVRHKLIGVVKTLCTRLVHGSRNKW